MKDSTKNVLFHSGLVLFVGAFLIFMYCLIDHKSIQIDFIRDCELECARKQYDGADYSYDGLFNNEKGQCVCHKVTQEIKF